MKALIKQTPERQKEIFYETDWLYWMDPKTGHPLNTYPYCYGLCEDALSDDPDDYVIEEHRPERKGDEDEAEITYTATLKRGWKPKEPEEEPESES